MRMIWATAWVLVLSVSISDCSAEEKSHSWSIYSGIETKYVGFGNGAVFYKHPFVSSGIYYQHKSGLHADVWWATGLNNDFSGDFDDEIDYNIGYAGKVRKVCFDFTIGYWDLVDLFDETYEDILHVELEASYPLTISSNLTLTPFIGFEAYLLPFGSDYEEGTISSTGSKYSIKLHPRILIDGLSSFGYDDGGFGYKTGFLFKNYTDLKWSVSEKFALSIPTIKVYTPLGIGDDRKTEWVFGATVTYSW